MPRIRAGPGSSAQPPSTLLERQTPLPAPVGVHDVSLETPVAVADEGDPPPVRGPGRTNVLCRVSREVPLSASVGVHDVDIPVAVSCAPESDLSPVRGPGRFGVKPCVVMRQFAGSEARCRRRPLRRPHRCRRASSRTRSSARRATRQEPARRVGAACPGSGSGGDHRYRAPAWRARPRPRRSLRRWRRNRFALVGNQERNGWGSSTSRAFASKLSMGESPGTARRRQPRVRLRGPSLSAQPGRHDSAGEHSRTLAQATEHSLGD